MAFTADDSASSNPAAGGNGLVSTAKMWGTPVARDDQKSPEAHLAMKQRALGRKPDAAVTSLTVQVKRNSPGLATIAALSGPQAETTTPDGPNGSQPVDLNPRFVEALMGVPPNWLTPSTSAETASYQRWLRLHSLSSPTVPASHINSSSTEEGNL